MKNPGAPKANISRRKSVFLAAFALLVLTIVVPPFVNINRFRHLIVQSISAGLDRPVYANSVELTLFPRPAFVLHHLTVAEWPQYGAEPVITAETVTASLRASTLWHRRVEIASLHFDAPSVNLARDSNGEWNFESLISNSPVLRLSGNSTSGASSSASPPPFPYVEATDARINFKRGAEKLPFSLEGAQLAFWKESGNEWHVRIKARPVRTDLPPGDAGQILGEASVKTTGVLMDSPIRASLEWRRGQLGEISRLLQGEDSGWRGTVDWTVNVRGTLGKARLTSDVQVEGFRRAEFIPPSEIDLSAHCTGQYVHADRRMDQFDCDAPLGGGHLLVKSIANDSNSAANPSAPVASQPSQSEGAGSFTVALQQASAGFFLDLLRHVHPGIAADTSASGEVNGSAKCEWRGFDTLQDCTGDLRTTPLTLHLPHVEHAVHLSPLLISTPNLAGAAKASASRVSSEALYRSSPIVVKQQATGAWNLAAVHASLGAATSAILAGTVTSSGLTLHIDGAADLRDLRQLARAMNLPVLSGGIHSIRGTAQMAVTLRSSWLPQSNPAAFVATIPNNVANLPTQSIPWFVPSQWEGKVQIHNATMQLSSFPGAIQIVGGQVNLTDTSVEWNGLTGTYAHIPFDGSIRWETSCPAARPPCARTFTLHTTDLNVDRLQGVLRRAIAGSGLLEQLNPWAAGAPELPEITGTFKADVLSAGKLSLQNASLQLHLQGHRADLVAISGKVFGGTLSGLSDDASGSALSGKDATEASSASTAEPVPAMQSGAGSAQWGDGPPTYTLRVALGNIQPNLVAAIWHEKWGRGAASVEIRLKTHGWSTADLVQNASGNFAIDWRGGVLAALMPSQASSMAIADSPSTANVVPGITRFQRLRAVGHFHDEKLTLEFGQLALASATGRRQIGIPGIQSLSGTVTFSRVLDLRMQPSGVSITGSLDLPIMKARAREQ
ncbi:MAG TPA: AsmA family protein [Acidobacteriaceae bacterium]|nr:AsmA family protein [Acidobacteriaceae bacterium]